MVIQNFSERNGLDKVLITLNEIMKNGFSKEQKTALATYVSEILKPRDKKFKAGVDISVRLQWIIHHSYSDDWLFTNKSGHTSEDARTHAYELKSMRNKLAHPDDDLSTGDAWRAADTAIRLLKILGLPTDRMEKLRQELPLPDSQKPSYPSATPSSYSRDSTEQIAVVTCAKKKLGHPAPAAELYIGQLFKESIKEVTKGRLRFLIMSSKYGLIHPDETIEPYEANLETMTEQQKLDLEELIEKQVKEKLTAGGVRHVVLLAGKDYRELLQKILNRHGITSETHRNWNKVRNEVYGPSR